MRGLSIVRFGYSATLTLLGRTSSPEEFQSTFDHEKGHLATHIALTDDIHLIGEEYQYLVGEIGKLMYPVAKYFLCEHCINELERFKGTYFTQKY